MYTYQDYEKYKDLESHAKMDFLKSAIEAHKNTDLYQTAVVAEEYDRHQNRTIMEYKKLLYKMSGEAVPDNYSANYKLPSNFFNRFVVQEVQYLLGNGVSWSNGVADGKFGDDFDYRMQKIAKMALIGGVAFGFLNLDHLETFAVTEFVPLYDENNGTLMAGIRFWQVDDDKPLRATLYELDGYTDFLWNKDERKVLKEKTAYVTISRGTKADETKIYEGKNYPVFPIVPLWGNPHHQSEIVGLREEIDAYDLIQSGFANDLDDASQIYWTISNASGMDDIDLAKFLDHMKTVRAAVVDDDGSKAEAHTLDVPFAAREAILTRLEDTMYKDAMALNVENIASGSVVTAQIRASYEPLNNKTDQFEACVIDFIQGLLDVAGIKDKPTFTRSAIVNAQEEIQLVLQSATFLPTRYVTEKILTLLGDIDRLDEVLEQMDEEGYQKMTAPIEEVTEE